MVCSFSPFYYINTTILFLYHEMFFREQFFLIFYQIELFLCYYLTVVRRQSISNNFAINLALFLLLSSKPYLNDVCPLSNNIGNTPKEQLVSLLQAPLPSIISNFSLTFFSERKQASIGGVMRGPGDRGQGTGTTRLKTGPRF